MDCKDGNGISISTYINKFSGYNIPGYIENDSFNIENKNPENKGNVKEDYFPYLLIGLGIVVIILTFKYLKT